MNIRINGVPISFELEQEQTVGDVYDGVVRWLHSSGHSLERVVLDEKEIGEWEGAWRSTPVASAETLDIDAKSIRERRIKDLGTIIHYVELLRCVLSEGDTSQRTAVLEELPHVSAGIRRNAPDLTGFLEEPLHGKDLSDPSVRETAKNRATEIIQLLEGRQRELLDPDREMRTTLDLLDSILPTFEEIPGQIQGGKRGHAMKVVTRFYELVSRELRIIPLTLEIYPCSQKGNDRWRTVRSRTATTERVLRRDGGGFRERGFRSIGRSSRIRDVTPLHRARRGTASLRCAVVVKVTHQRATEGVPAAIDYRRLYRVVYNSMVPKTRITVSSVEETEEVARTIASSLTIGDVIGLTGGLGAGKSVMVRAAARALGVTERMPSPTYTIVEEYEGAAAPILHVDLYRLSDPEEFIYLGIEEVFPRSIAFIEWVRNAVEACELMTVAVSIESDPNDAEARTITIERHSRR